MHGRITGPGNYEHPEGWSGVAIGTGEIVEGGNQIITAAEALEKFISQLDNEVETAEKNAIPEQLATTEETETDVLQGFPEKIEGEILFLDADNISTDAIYPGKYTYQDDVSIKKMAQVCMENYDPRFDSIARVGDILVSGFNFGCGSSREQAATSILAKELPLVVSGSVGNTFGRNAINNALPLLEMPRLVERLRENFSSTEVQTSQEAVKEPSHNHESLDSPPPAAQATPEQERKLTRRTDWKFSWDIKFSKVTIQEGNGGPIWSQYVAALPLNLQEIIVCGGLEKWVKKQIGHF